MTTTGGWRKEVLLEDERGRASAAVVRYGPYLFLSGSDGDRSPETEAVDARLAGEPAAQIRNSYGRVQRRLEQCGYGARAVVRLEHFVSSQDWLLLRLGLWKQYFGVDLCTGGGAQASMASINMLSTVAMAVTPDAARATIEPPPAGPLPGTWAAQKKWVERAYAPEFELEGVRPAKTVRGGDFAFTVGVRGLVHPETHALAPVLTDQALETQVRYSFDELRVYLQPAGIQLRDLVRLDVPFRDINRAAELRALARDMIGQAPACALHVVGMAVGGASETDIEGIATWPGVERQVTWSERDPEYAVAVTAGGLTFVSGCSGLFDEPTGRLHLAGCGDPVEQTRHAFRELAQVLERTGVQLSDVLRLDVFVRDVYFAERFFSLAREAGLDSAAISIVGAQPAHCAEIDVSAIAAAQGQA